ncbi:hypothetical protein Vretimale_5520 [Volvox reticuliferus]|uniref:Uncharacterized protein n=1 Tax=Volvox reticuliferus TaxID=1737510 RepID=A0A8J4C6R0_9CHLO|nr:hypothetical protein Vretifemale_5521 [Volvox reticuliferus]GIM00522.1 hypothetical protein Vretimale_5520 [Volvox reticuliferus]
MPYENFNRYEMASSVTGDGYSPLATPTRSSLRQPAFTGTSNSVRFFGITNDDDADDDHTSGVGPTQGRSSIAIKQAIFHKYFNEFATYPLLLVNVSNQNTPGNSRAHSRVSKGVKSAIDASSIPYGDHIKAKAAWTSLSTTHVPSDYEPSRPRWAISKRPPGVLQKGADVEYGSGPLHTATKAVTTDGSLKSHLHSFETLLAKPWTNKQVQQAQTHGFFWRLVPHLGVERLQGPAALLLARCARLRPALLLPLIQRLCAVLPLLINSPRQDVRQAGLCLLGLLWRAATDGASQLPSAILATPRLMEALTARADEGNFDALWAVRELAADGRGVPALERCGALQAVCRALKHIAAAAAAAAPPGGNAEAESGREGGKEHGGDREGRRGRGHGYRKLAGEAPAAESGAAVSVGDQKNERGSKRAGVTAGGDVVERAASGVLVAECLAAFSVEHFAVLLMCDSQKVPSKWATPERNRVPERLISLLLLTGADLDKEAQEGGNEGTEEEEANEEGGQRQGGHGNGKTVSNPGSGSVDGGSREGANAAEATFRESPSNLKPPGRAAPDGAVSTDPGSAARRSEDVYSEDFASEAEGQGSEGTDTGRTRGVGGNSGDGDGGGGGGGAGDSGSEGRRSGTVEEGRSGNGVAAAAPAGSGGGGGGVKGSIGGGEQGTAAAGRGSGSGSGSGGDGDDVRKKDHQADPRVSLVRKAQRQLHDALLRSLYIIASSGHCQKPQQVVQEALRGAGDPAVERLAAVLRGRPRTQSGASDAAAKEFPSLAACCSASYLLWLIASGDFSHSEASELNVLRSRMGKDAPSRHERETDTGGDTGGSSQYFTCGFGVVQAVTELLLVHLPVWQNPDFGDCVPSVGTTTLPPPPPAVNVGINNGDGRSGGSIAAVGTVAPGGEVATGAAGAGPVPRLGPQYGAGSGGVLNGAVNPRPTRMSSKVACNAEDVGGGRILSTPQTSETQATDPRVAHEGGGDAPATVRRMVPPLPIASTTGLLLTPRDTRGAACSAASPQERYGRGDSSDDDVAGSGGDAHGGNNGTGYSSGTADGGMKRNDSSATADRLSSTQDLDLSNVIDSSVELTGKEQLMRIIAAAGSALSKEGELRQGDEGCEGMVSEQGEPGAEHTPMAAANGDPPDGSAAAVNPTTAPQAATANTAPSDGPTQGPLDRAESPSDKSDASAGSGCTPLDVPVSGGDSSGGGKDGAARLPPLTVARPPALVLPTDAAGRRTPPPPPPRPSVVPTPTTWLNAVRFVRQQHTCVSSPTAAEVQELQTCCMGLLAAVALSAGGCRAVCSQPNLLPYIASLLELADVSDGDAATASSPAAAALGSSGQELRLQLLALLTNLSLHEAGAAALTTAVSSATSRPLGEGLYRTAEMAIRLISGSTTSWRLGAQLLEACFTIMTNIHRSQAVLRLAADHSSGEQRDSFRLATEALRVPLAPSIGVVDRTRIRAAAARCLDSAIAAYEGVGRSLAPQRRSGIIRAPSAKAGSHRAATAIAAPAAEEKALISELIWLLAGGAAIAAAAGGGAVASAAAAAERAAIDGAGALWQLMASGTVHPDDVISDLEPPLVSVLGSTRAAVDSERPAALRLAALGLVSCLARGAAVARRLWTSPLLPAVLKTHAFARRRCADGGAESWLPVLECVRGVCQMLCRACHRADRGDVVGPDKRVDKWGLTERMLSELRCKLEYDADEDAIMLVLREEATEALGKGGDGSGGGSGEYNDDYDE